MKFLVSIALATFVAVASAANDCAAEESKIPICAEKCINGAARHCEYGDVECNCSPDHLDEIIELSADCVAAACKGAGPVFPPLRKFCKCKLAGVTPTTTSTKPTPTPTCAAQESKIPICAQKCINGAARHCEYGDVQCNCSPDHLDEIIELSKDCVADACKGAGPVFPPLREFCKCKLGGVSSTTSSSSTKPPKTTTSSTTASSTTASSTTASPSKSSTSTTVETSEPATTSTSNYVTLTSTITTTTVCTITSCAPNATACATGGLTTETRTLTTTWCPETETLAPTTPWYPVETQGYPTGPGTGYPTYPSQTGGPGAPGPSYVASSTPVPSQPPVFNTAGTITRKTSGLVAGILAVFAGLAWL